MLPALSAVIAVLLAAGEGPDLPADFCRPPVSPSGHVVARNRLAFDLPAAMVVEAQANVFDPRSGEDWSFLAAGHDGTEVRASASSPRSGRLLWEELSKYVDAPPENGATVSRNRAGCLVSSGRPSPWLTDGHSVGVAVVCASGGLFQYLDITATAPSRDAALTLALGIAESARAADDPEFHRGSSAAPDSSLVGCYRVEPGAPSIVCLETSGEVRLRPDESGRKVEWKLGRWSKWNGHVLVCVRTSLALRGWYFPKRLTSSGLELKESKWIRVSGPEVKPPADRDPPERARGRVEADYGLPPGLRWGLRVDEARRAVAGRLEFIGEEPIRGDSRTLMFSGVLLPELHATHAALHFEGGALSGLTLFASATPEASAAHRWQALLEHGTKLWGRPVGPASLHDLWEVYAPLAPKEARLALPPSPMPLQLPPPPGADLGKVIDEVVLRRGAQGMPHGGWLSAWNFRNRTVVAVAVLPPFGVPPGGAHALAAWMILQQDQSLEGTE